MKKFFLFVFLFLPSLVMGQNVKTFIPPAAGQYLPALKHEVERFAPEIEYPWYFPALVEHESCITLKHKRCWNPTAELKNNREHGVGFFQMTRAWNSSGVLRFDNVTMLAKKYRTHLGELSWSNIKQRPDLQLRAGVLLWMESYNGFPAMEEGIERMKFADSSFNGGISHVRKSRQICTLTKGCNPNVWYSNVEKYLPKSKTPDRRYGGRSMYDINTHHVRDIFENRMDKYKLVWD